MKLKTLIVFAAIGLAVSAPELSRRFGNSLTTNDGNHSPGNALSSALPVNNQVFPGATGPSRPQATQQGFLSRIFGSFEPVETPPQTAGPMGGPFIPGLSTFGTPSQFASNRRVLADGTVVTTSPPLNVLPGAYSQSVYQPFADFNEFLRFDISPAWVKQRWPRVSSVPGEDGLQGLRVALVSGPRPVDIHGSLTYFFDQQQRAQRINFRGWTGGASLLASFVESAGFRRRDTNGAALFTLSSWGRTKGVARFDHPPVSTRQLPNEQLMVLLELTNASSSFSVSDQTEQILAAMQRRR